MVDVVGGAGAVEVEGHVPHGVSVVAEFGV